MLSFHQYMQLRRLCCTRSFTDIPGVWKDFYSCVLSTETWENPAVPGTLKLSQVPCVPSQHKNAKLDSGLNLIWPSPAFWGKWSFNQPVDSIWSYVSGLGCPVSRKDMQGAQWRASNVVRGRRAVGKWGGAELGLLSLDRAQKAPACSLQPWDGRF